jgi:hypothetical protein
MIGGTADQSTRFRPRMTLRTLTRGDGLLGMKPSGPFGPRGGQVTVVKIDWTYFLGSDLRWEAPAPTGLLNRRPPSEQHVEDLAGQTLTRDFDAEADALDGVIDAGLHPLPPENLQWRTEQAAGDHGYDGSRNNLWTLVQEDFFSDFWAERLPLLQAQGWHVVVCPGFAHESVPVEAWRLIVNPVDGEVIGKEVAAPMAGRPRAMKGLGLPADEGSWLLSLGIEIDGEQVDLVPLLAHLIQTDTRWIDAKKIALIDDAALIRLRAPGGKRIDTPAAPLKAIRSVKRVLWHCRHGMPIGWKRCARV